MKTKNAILFTLIILSFYSCKKDKENASYKDLTGISCDPNFTPDSITALSGLYGKHRLIMEYCCGSECTKTYPAINVELIVDIRGMYTLTEDGVTTGFGSWEMEKINNQYRLKTAGFQKYTYGTIALCGDILIFSNISADGCDNIYEKEN